MSRHPGLAELSREHRLELSQARELRRATAVDPETRLAVAAAYVDGFFGETVEHFRREEEQVFPLYARHAGGTALLARVLSEHMQLQGLARELRAEVAAGDARPETVAALGTLLAQHVRLEERELFAEIERVVPAAELEALR